MRRPLFFSFGLLGVAVITSQCGGTTFTSGGGDDASVDGASDASGSGSGSSSGGSSASGSSSGTSSSSGGSSSTSGGSSGSSTSSGGSSSSSGSSSGSSGGSGSSSGGGSCNPPCGPGRLCCNHQCVNPDNDPTNCGGCGIQCSGTTPYCDGSCKPPPCTGVACLPNEPCCGSMCCGQGQICCKDDGPQTFPTCYTPTSQQPTCPQGCAPSCVSDRNLKRDVEPVDEQAVLQSVERMPIATWSYKSEDPRVRHMGPMAQDFYAAFGLGDTDRAYSPIDAHGVAFAAIKALAERVDAQDARIEALERENAQLRAARCAPP